MDFYRYRGFTLVELLVVISILGLLATMLLVRMRQSQFEAYDSAIQQTFNTLRNRAGIDFHESGNFDAVCEENGGDSGDSNLSPSGDYLRVEQNVMMNNGNRPVVCNEGAGSLTFAVWTPLRATAGTFYCTDHNYTYKTLTVEPPGGTTECP